MSEPSEVVRRLAEQRLQQLHLERPDAVEPLSIERVRLQACSVPSRCSSHCLQGCRLSTTEELLLRALVEEHSDELSSFSLPRPPSVVDGALGPTTRVYSDGQSQRCSWLTTDAGCVLELIAQQHGVDPQLYQPLNCILYPLEIKKIGDIRVLGSSALLNTAPVVEPMLGASLNIRLDFLQNLWNQQFGWSFTSSDLPPQNAIGLVASNARHSVWAYQKNTETVAVKIPVTSEDRKSLRREKECLQNLRGDRFSRLSSLPSGVPSDSLATRYFVGHVGLDLWVRSKPTKKEISQIARELLELCLDLEHARLLHLDFCSRNLLVDFRQLRVSLIDFENTSHEKNAPLCQGGSHGMAAPEQYINYLGQHTHFTQSFFVGTFLFYAFHPEFRRSGNAFPFSRADADRMPEKLHKVMWSLLGDPLSRYAVNTRLPAAEVLRQWGTPIEKRTQSENIQNTQHIAPKELFVHGPDGVVLIVHKRGLLLYQGEQLIDQWDGLVDLATIPLQWEGNELCLGGVRATPEGFRSTFSLAGHSDG